MVGDNLPVGTTQDAALRGPLGIQLGCPHPVPPLQSPQETLKLAGAVSGPSCLTNLGNVSLGELGR